MDRADLWTEHSLSMTKRYCEGSGVGLAIAEVDFRATSDGRDEDDFYRPKVNYVRFNEGLDIIFMPEK